MHVVIQIQPFRRKPRKLKSLFSRNKQRSKDVKHLTTASEIKSCADLFPPPRCPSVIKFKIRLECARVNRSNVLLISTAYFPANKMNLMQKLKDKWRKIQRLIKSFLMV